MSLPKARLTAVEYLALERKTELKSDFYEGEMFAMGGGSQAHSLITMNIGGSLWQRLKGKPCRPYSNDLRILIPTTGLYTYPDVPVVCGPLDSTDHLKDTITNPAAVFEVLSDSTEAYDRGIKFFNYRTIPSLRYYVLVSQKNPVVEVYSRENDGSWKLVTYTTLDEVVALPQLQVELPLSEIYDGLEFDQSLPAT